MATIAIDTSAFVAIFRSEPIATDVRNCISKSTRIVVPATCLVELSLLGRIDRNLLGWARELVDVPPYQLVPITTEEAILAAETAGRYGKGSGHPAQLNFGDCLVYAAAQHRNIPLLFTGNDFSRTDIIPALAVS